jgi:hypothetical protein
LPPRARIHNVFHVVFLKKFEVAPPDAVVISGMTAPINLSKKP